MKGGLLGLTLALLVGCGGKYTHDAAPAPAPSAEPPPPIPTSCITSVGCPAGFRCDATACVADTTCPPAQPPQLLLEAPSGSAWAVDRVFDILLGGHERLMADGTGVLYFYDLVSGTPSTLDHDSGRTSCSGDPVLCYTREGSAFTLYQGLSLSGSRWLPASTRSYGGGIPFGSAADFAAQRLPVWDGLRTVSLLDMGSGSLAFSLPFKDSLLGNVSDAQGLTSTILTFRNGTDGAAVLSAPLRDGASFEVAYQGDSVGGTAVLLSNSTPRYAVRDNGLLTSGTRVERVENGVPKKLGAFDDPPAAAFYREYMSSRPLEPGNTMYALDCESRSQCRSFLLHLEPVALQAVDQEPWPDGNPGLVSNVSHLACGAVDLIFTSRDPQTLNERVWSLRLTGHAGLP